MIRGVTVGKFLPFHQGHSYLIEQALTQCDELSVLVCDRKEWAIPASVRKAWIEQIHPEAKVFILQDDIDDLDHEGWALKTVEAIGARPDLVFTSETYGAPYAAALGAESRMVDAEREHVAISATQIRDDPWANWEFLHPAVRAYFTRRFALVGPESTGKTTLAAALASHYGTTWASEYARDYSIEHAARIESGGWKEIDYVQIAAQQNAREDEAAAKANRLLFCDTDSFAVSIWYDAHENLRSTAVENLARNRNYSLYFLMDTDVPFEDDGIRIGRKFRDAVFSRYQKKLRMWSKPYVLLSGDFETRLASAISIIDSIVADEAASLPGLTRDRWHPTSGF